MGIGREGGTEDDWVKVPKWRTCPSGPWRAETTRNSRGGREEGDVMVPVSEGWPSPWAWKIVEVVIRTVCAEVPSLKRLH